MKLSVCIEKLWPKDPYPERIRRIAEAGFPVQEFWDFGNKDLDTLANLRKDLDLTFAACCLRNPKPLTAPADPGDLEGNVRGSAKAGSQLGIDTFIITVGDCVPQEAYGVTRNRVVRRLNRLAWAAESAGITLVLEPLNPVVDHVGHWLTDMAQAADLVEAVGSSHLKILMDLYHQQITEGNLCDCISRWFPLIGHFHAAGVPGRGSPAAGEVNYRHVFQHIADLGFAGSVGLEFVPGDVPVADLRATADLFPQT